MVPSLQGGLGGARCPPETGGRTSLVSVSGAPKKTDYTDVSDVAISDEKRERLYTAQTECCVNWTNRQGWPVGVMHRYVWHEGKFWITCMGQRKRVPALRARPQSSIVVSSEGTWLGGDITTTAKTLATVHDDNTELKGWFYPMLAARLRAGDTKANAEFSRRLDTPGRVIIELDPQEWISYDGTVLETSLRGQPHSPNLVKRSRNIIEPPEGWTMEYL
jgi:hypothetical protein